MVHFSPWPEPVETPVPTVGTVVALALAGPDSIKVRNYSQH